MVDTFFVTDEALRRLKKNLGRAIPEVPSAHLGEILAASLGMRTYAALRVGLNAHRSVQTGVPDALRAALRMRELGYTDTGRVRQGLVQPMSRAGEPVKPYAGQRQLAWRNMMVGAINAAIEQRVIGLGPTENYWQHGKAMERSALQQARGTFAFMLAPGLPALGTVEDIGCGEVRVYAAVRPHAHVTDARFAHGHLRDAEATAAGWLERELGLWLQDSRSDVSCRRTLVAELAALNIKPAGYGDRGKVLL